MLLSCLREAAAMPGNVLQALESLLHGCSYSQNPHWYDVVPFSPPGETVRLLHGLTSQQDAEDPSLCPQPTLSPLPLRHIPAPGREQCVEDEELAEEGYHVSSRGKNWRP